VFLSLYCKLMARMATMRSDEQGATAVEYGMMVALIAAVIVGLITTLGTDIKTAFQTIITAIPGGGA